MTTSMGRRRGNRGCTRCSPRGLQLPVVRGEDGPEEPERPIVAAQASEQHHRRSQLLMPPIPLSRLAVRSCARLALPVDQLTADGVVAVPGGRRERRTRECRPACRARASALPAPPARRRASRAKSLLGVRDGGQGADEGEDGGPELPVAFHGGLLPIARASERQTPRVLRSVGLRPLGANYTP